MLKCKAKHINFYPYYIYLLRLYTITKGMSVYICACICVLACLLSVSVNVSGYGVGIRQQKFSICKINYLPTGLKVNAINIQKITYYIASYYIFQSLSK